MLLEVLAAGIVVSVIAVSGGRGLAVLLGLLMVWQLIYRLKYGYWMRGIDH
jgi:hypothetical protein